MNKNITGAGRWTPEARKRQSELMKKRWTPEARARQSKIMKRDWKKARELNPDNPRSVLAEARKERAREHERLKIEVNINNLPILRYGTKNARGPLYQTYLTKHSGSDSWYIINSGLGKSTKTGAGVPVDAIDVRNYKKFIDGGDENTLDVLKNAFYLKPPYTGVFKDDIKYLKIGGKKIVYSEKKDVFVYVDMINKVDKETFEKYF